MLIADGDRQVQDLLRHALSQEDYQLEFVAGGEEVLRRISAEEIDVIIVEVHLADVPAWHLIPRLHRIDQDLPIITITADDSWETSRRVRVECGPVFFYGLKPLDEREMQKVVGCAVNWRGKQQGPGGEKRSQI